MCDGFLTLARLEDRVTCFFVPRSLPDGTRNPFYLQRLKDKIGNRSNASSEIEFRNTSRTWSAPPARGIADTHRDGAPHALRHRRRGRRA